MNNTNLRILLGFIFGTAIGGGVSYVVTKDICDKKKKQELEEVRDIYRKKIENLVEPEMPVERILSPSKGVSDKTDEDSKEAAIARFKARNEAKGVIKQEDYVTLPENTGTGMDYTRYYADPDTNGIDEEVDIVESGYSDDDYNIDIQEESLAERESPSDDEPFCYIMDEDEVGRTNYEPIPATFWLKDKVLSEDTTYEEIPIDCDSITHDVIEEMIDRNGSMDEWDFIVRNKKMGIVYEVSISDGSYAEYVNDEGVL